MWLAGASLLAIALGLGEASADGFSFQEIIPLTGYYEFRVAGADGGGNGTDPGGAGAVVGGELFLEAGNTLSAVVGGGGGSPRGAFPQYGGGGGGGSFVFLDSSYRGGGLLFAAAGGDGQSFFSEGFPGQPGSAYGGHPAGPASYGGSPDPASPSEDRSPDLSSRRSPDPSPTAAQGHVAISGVEGREASAAAVAAAMMAAAAAAAFPALAATAAAILT
jgi:hypothetical protein